RFRSEGSALVSKAQSIVRRRCPWPEDSTGQRQAQPPQPGQSRQQYMEHFSAALGRAVQSLRALQNQPAARFIEEGWLILTILALLPLTTVAFWWFLWPVLGPIGVLIAS